MSVYVCLCPGAAARLQSDREAHVPRSCGTPDRRAAMTRRPPAAGGLVAADRGRQAGPGRADTRTYAHTRTRTFSLTYTHTCTYTYTRVHAHTHAPCLRHTHAPTKSKSREKLK